MLKKLLFAAGGIGLLGAMFFGRDASSYVTTSYGRVKEAVRDSVPVEFEISRAREMLANLGPEIRHNMHVIAKEEVELERLAEQVARLDEKLAKDKGELLHLQADLRSGEEVFRYAGRAYAKDDVKRVLAARFNRYKTEDLTLSNLQKIYDARSRKLESSRQKLEEMLAARRNLEVELENIDAQREMIAVAQTAAEYHFDETRLGRIKELVADLNARLQVEEKLAHMSGELHEDIPMLSPEPETDIAEEVAAYFQEREGDGDVQPNRVAVDIK